MTATSTTAAILAKACSILSEHGVKVEQVPGWQTRTGSSRTLIPQGVVVHHTGDPSTPLSLIRDGRTGLPGPLANFLVGQSGRVYLVAAGYSNNAGYGGETNFATIVKGQVGSELKPPSSDGNWSANSHAWSIEGDGRGDWPATVREHTIMVAAALHIAHGWTGHARVIAHKELTRRKPGDPGDNMGKVRAEVLALVREWTGTPAPAPKPPANTRPTLRKGSKGSAVRDLQTILRKLGYKGDLLNRKALVVDEIFGAKTARAVRRYQKAKGLKVDEIVGPKTWASLLG